MEKPLTEMKKAKLDALMDFLIEYLHTDGGNELFLRFQDLMQRMRPPEQRIEEQLLLTAKESRALAFIQKELKNGNSPSVRAVAAAMGMKSSRSGLGLIRSLITKGRLKRSADTGKLLSSLF